MPSISRMSGIGGRQRTSSNVSSASAIAIARRPPGASAARARRRNRGAAVGAAEQLDGLHGHEDQAEPPLAEVEVAGVGRDGLDRQPGRAGAQGGEQVGRAVERDDPVALAGEVERHAPGPGADVEHRPGVADREIAPQRQVLGVGAALDVVPDDLGHVRVLRPGRAHAKLLPAAPRATSTSRSPSIAV